MSATSVVQRATYSASAAGEGRKEGGTMVGLRYSEGSIVVRMYEEDDLGPPVLDFCAAGGYEYIFLILVSGELTSLFLHGDFFFHGQFYQFHAKLGPQLFLGQIKDLSEIDASFEEDWIASVLIEK